MSRREESGLPPGYRIVLTDPEVVQLLEPWGESVFVFSRYGTTVNAVEKVAWEHYAQANQEEESS